jgi:hypothetical protein
MKGKLIKLQLADGRKVAAIILYRNGTTLTIKAVDTQVGAENVNGYIYDVSDYDENGVWYASA